jgi:hypothetical protein
LGIHIVASRIEHKRLGRHGYAREDLVGLVERRVGLM